MKTDLHRVWDLERRWLVIWAPMHRMSTGASKEIAPKQLYLPLHLARAEVAYSTRYPEGLSVITEGD